MSTFLVAEFVSKGNAMVVRQVKGQAGKLSCSSGLGSHPSDIQSRGTPEGHMGMATAQLGTIPPLIKLRAEPNASHGVLGCLDTELWDPAVTNMGIQPMGRKRKQGRPGWRICCVT